MAAGLDPLHYATLDLHVQQVVGAAVDLIVHYVKRVVCHVRRERLAEPAVERDRLVGEGLGVLSDLDQFGLGELDHQILSHYGTVTVRLKPYPAVPLGHLSFDCDHRADWGDIVVPVDIPTHLRD